jgi:hypothetical protein
LGLTPKEAILAHHWNARLCATLYPILQIFELTLRNSIDNAVCTSIRSNYKGDGWWFEKMATVVQDKKIRKMTSSTRKSWVDVQGKRLHWKFGYFESNIRKAKKVLREQSRSVNPGAVMSNQAFGFWVGMLDEDFQDIRTKKLLWPNLLNDVFPNATVSLNLVILSEKAKDIKDLRNRISHHEPVWKFFETKSDGTLDYTTPIRGIESSLHQLRQRYDSIMEYIRWMSVKAYNEIHDAGLSQDFEYLCTKKELDNHLNQKNVSTIKRRLQRY